MFDNSFKVSERYGWPLDAASALTRAAASVWFEYTAWPTQVRTFHDILSAQRCQTKLVLLSVIACPSAEALQRCWANAKLKAHHGRRGEKPFGALDGVGCSGTRPTIAGLRRYRRDIQFGKMAWLNQQAHAVSVTAVTLTAGLSGICVYTVCRSAI